MRLSVRIYLAFVATGLLAMVGAGAVTAGWFSDRPSPADLLVVGVSEVAALPGGPGLAAALDALAEELDADLTVYGPDGAVLGVSGRELPDGPPGTFRALGGAAARVALPDGRRVAFRRRSDGGRRAVVFGVLALVGLGLGTWPLARRITRRLDRLERAATRFGAGELSARARVDGADEVARVGAAFDHAADRVERLVEAHRRVLASASHELRSPLGRLRVALEILAERAPDPLLDDAVRDVEALDATVGDLLRLGRLQAGEAAAEAAPVDLEALLRPLVPLEPDPAGAHGAARSVRGDAALLRICARNLVENARRHGGEPVTARVGGDGFSVLDRGPGVPEALRERIFEPFFRPEGHAEGRDGGVGLGLHLAREIARVHGGGLVCLPREGGGSEFRVTLS